jgi:hypothetical protein
MRTSLAPGARTRPEHGGPSRQVSHDVWPVAVPPANGRPVAGIPDLGSSAGSRTAARTCVRTLCAGRSADGAGALWRNGGALTYRGRRPWEARLPRESSGRMRQRSPRALSKTRTKRLPTSLRPSEGTRQRTRRFLRRAHWKETPESTAGRLALTKRSRLALISCSVPPAASSA